MQHRNFSSPLDFDPKEDYYKILEVREKASQAEIKNAFFRLAQFYHPDKGGGKHTLEKFQNITNAYQVLNNESKRKRYDAIRKGQADPEIKNYEEKMKKQREKEAKD